MLREIVDDGALLHEAAGFVPIAPQQTAHENAAPSMRAPRATAFCRYFFQPTIEASVI